MVQEKLQEIANLTLDKVSGVTGYDGSKYPISVSTWDNKLNIDIKNIGTFSLTCFSKVKYNVFVFNGRVNTVQQRIYNEVYLIMKNSYEDFEKIIFN